MNTQFDHPFRVETGRILQSGRSNTVVMAGNVHDLFYLPPAYTGTNHGGYVHMTEYLTKRWGMSVKGQELVAKKNPGVMFLVYGLNGSIRFVDKDDEKLMCDAWIKSQTGLDQHDLAIEQMLRSTKDTEPRKPSDEFREYLTSAIGRPAIALQLLRKFCQISRKSKEKDPLANKSLVMVIEWADMMLPEGEIVRLNDSDRHRIMICQDWFSDPEFVNSRDAIILLTESTSLLNHRLLQLPHVAKVSVPSPDQAARTHFIDWFDEMTGEAPIPLWDTKETLAVFSAGLSLQALHQLLKGAMHEKTAVQLKDVIASVEAYIKSQLGEGVVEFKQPMHTFADVVGCRKLKALCEDQLIRRVQSTGKDAITGIGVAGPVGGGKSFAFEALAATVGMPILVLKNIRSQWFGQTDVLIEKLYRVLISLSKVMILVDEADTVFGGVGPNTHDTERRLTGTIQGWMADPRLRGKVVWLLMTARIHLLSPDMRRPGRLGIIIPMPDPIDEDYNDFVELILRPVKHLIPNREGEEWKKVQAALKGYSAGAFQLVGSELDALMIRKKDATLDDVLGLIHDQLPSDIATTRRYQLLQAFMNATRRSLLPNPENADADREAWAKELRELEARGVTGY